MSECFYQNIMCAGNLFDCLVFKLILVKFLIAGFLVAVTPEKTQT